MQRSVGLTLLLLSLGTFAGCSGKEGNSDDDDDNGAAMLPGGGAGSTGATSSAGGAGAQGGTGAMGGSAAGAKGGTGGSSGSAGAQQFIQGGPFAYPQNEKPPFCTLTTVANASATVQSIYTTWKNTYVVSASPGLRVQRPENGNDTVSEGIGYGMLAAVYMGDRPTFDGLWAYASAQGHIDMAGLMNWHLNADGTVAAQGSGSATDADEDMAWALLMASGQWSSPDYYAAGKKLAAAIMFNEVAGDGMLTPGDQWGSTNKTYPDYFSPAYFRVFKTVTGNANWDIVIKRNYEILTQVSGQYGLVPDQTTTSYDLSQSYKYDACRAPWRIGMDLCFNGPTVAPDAKTYIDKISTFFDGVGAANIGDGYSLTGMKTSNFPNMAFIGPAGVSGMASHQKLLDDAFTFGATGNGGTTGYFQQTLRVVTMLVMSGNFIDYTQQ